MSKLTYSIVVRNPNSWDASTGIHEEFGQLRAPSQNHCHGTSVHGSAHRLALPLRAYHWQLCAVLQNSAKFHFRPLVQRSD